MNQLVNKAAGEIADRSKVEALEDAIVQYLEPQEPETFHHFSQGLYCREMRMPKGMVLTGKVHKQDHIAMLTNGRVAITTGGDQQILNSPVIIPSKAGVKRAILALEDAVFITVHATELTDIDEIEAALVEEPRPHIVRESKQ